MNARDLFINGEALLSFLFSRGIRTSLYDQTTGMYIIANAKKRSICTVKIPFKEAVWAKKKGYITPSFIRSYENRLYEGSKASDFAQEMYRHSLIPVSVTE